MAKRVGDASLTAARAAVPFEYIAPKPEEVWKGSSRDGFVVPIGRAGVDSTHRRQAALAALQDFDPIDVPGVDLAELISTGRR